MLSVILLAAVTTNYFLGYKYFKLKNDINETNIRMNEINKSIEDKRTQLNTLNEEYQSYDVDNSDLMKEYINWKRQNQKLEDILR